MTTENEKQSDTKKELRTLARWIYYLAQGYGLFLALVGTFLYCFVPPPPLSFTSLSTFELDDWDSIPLDHFFLKSCYPLVGTPYIFCEFCKLFEPEIQKKRQNSQINKIVLIDWIRGKIVFYGEWENVSVSNFGPRDSYSFMNCKGIFLEEGSPRLLFHRDGRNVPDFLFKIRLIPDFLFKIAVKPDHQMWTVDLKGNNRKLKNFFYPYLFDQWRCRPMELSHILGLSWNNLNEYEIRDEKLQKVHRWPDAAESTDIIFQLPDGGYLLNQSDPKAFVFLHRNAPQSVQFDYTSILQFLPDIPSHSERKMWIVPISIGNTQTILAYLTIPGYPIFAFHTDHFGSGNIGDKVQFIGYGVSHFPLWAFNENRDIVFAANSNFHRNSFGGLFSQQYVFSSVLSFAKADSLPQNLVTDSTSCFAQHILPEPLSRISLIPLNETRFLAYCDQTFWSVQWETMEIEQIFPRSPIAPLTPRTLKKSQFTIPDQPKTRRQIRDPMRTITPLNEENGEDFSGVYRYIPDVTSNILVH